MKYLKLLLIALLTVLFSTGLSAKAPVKTRSGLNPKQFITTVDGKKTALYTLKNRKGMEACITNYGGRVVSLMVPDKKGKMRDVVLGHDNINDYINIDGNFGALIGRYGNRINQGCFTLNGNTYHLPQNNYGHCLHGGPKGFHHRVWDANQPNDTTLCLRLTSPDGEDGFPGNIIVDVTYTLTSDNGLRIDYEATTDKPTILNLTNHSYFNLSGDGDNTVLNDVMYINADHYTPIDDTFMTYGLIAPVADTPLDFRTPKPIGQDIEQPHEQMRNALGIDHNFVLNTQGDLTQVAATVYCPATEIRLDVLTSEPGLQVYSGNFLDGTVTGKRGDRYPRNSAIVLETQHYPDSPNKPWWPSVVVNPGDTYRSTCIYRFSTGNSNE